MAAFNEHILFSGLDPGPISSHHPFVDKEAEDLGGTSLALPKLMAEQRCVVLLLLDAVPLPPFGQVQQTMPALGFFSNDLQHLTFSVPGSCDYILACHLAL